MKRLQYSLLAAAGILVLAFVLTAIGPKRVLAALGYTPVREVDAPGRQPFSIKLSIPFSSLPTFTVPANKRLVITYVDAFVDPLQKYGDALEIDSTVNGQASSLFIPFTLASGPPGFQNHYAAQQVMGFADPGTTVLVKFFAFTADSATVNIHGYYLDAP